MTISARSGRHLSSRDAVGPSRAAVLVLHGGRVTGRQPVTPYQLAVLRADWLARAVHSRLAAHGISVWTLRFGVRGWNGAQASPVADALWAMDELERHSGVPVVLVGHSMGARAALRVAGSRRVRGVVALAPWVPDGEPVAQLAGRSLVIAHGTDDRITDPAASARYADRARAVADSVEFSYLQGEGHAMLSKAREWHDLAAAGALDLLERKVPDRHNPNSERPVSEQ